MTPPNMALNLRSVARPEVNAEAFPKKNRAMFNAESSWMDVQEPGRSQQRFYHLRTPTPPSYPYTRKMFR